MTPENPFAPVHARKSFFETPRRAELLRRLDDGLGAREPFLLVTGGPGTGKTVLAHHAVARWGSRVTAAFLAYPALTGAELLEEIIRRFGAEPPDGANRSKLVACIERVLEENTGRGQVSMLVIDDAHVSPPELLEELRLLANAAQQSHRPLELMLIGLPSLEARLEEPALAALRQRVSVHARVEPLSPSETRHYLHHRIAAVGGDGPTLFSRKSCRDIAERTGGVPRRINALGAEALRVALAWGDPTVGSEHVQTAAAAIWGSAATSAPTTGVDGDSPPAIAPARSPATASAAAAHPAPAPKAPIAPTPAAHPLPAPVARVAPAPAAHPLPALARVAPTPAAPSRPRIEEFAPPSHTPPAKHDSSEWVARFVGDKGPLQISSRFSESTWKTELSEVEAGESRGQLEASLALAGRSKRGRPRSGSNRRAGSRVAMTAVLASIAVIAALALVVRMGGRARNRTGQVAQVASTVAAPREPQQASKVKAPRARRDGVRAAVVTPAAGEPYPDVPATTPQQPYTLDVCSYSDEQTALDQRERLQELTGFQGWVVAVADGGSTPYHVVLGAYRSHERATAAAQMLMNSKTLSDVTVVPLPPRSARQ